MDWVTPCLMMAASTPRQSELVMKSQRGGSYRLQDFKMYVKTNFCLFVDVPVKVWVGKTSHSQSYKMQRPVDLLLSSDQTGTRQTGASCAVSSTQSGLGWAGLDCLG